VTTPAPNLRGRYHSALSSRRWSGHHHSSEATIFEDKVAEDSLSQAKQDTKTNPSPQERPSPKMWPFADSEGNPRIESLVPAEDKTLAGSEVNPPKESSVSAEDMSIAAVEAERRNSTLAMEQQENSGTSLRPSKSLSSLQLTPQRRGLYVPPGTALSQSSEVYAQGEVTSPPRQADKQGQPSSEQAVQEHDHVPGPGQEPANINHSKDVPEVREDNVANALGLDQKLAPITDDQRGAQAAAPSQDDLQQYSTSVQGGAQTLEPTTVLESEEPLSPTSDPAAKNAQASVPKPVLSNDSGAQTSQPTILESKEPQSPTSDPAAKNAQASVAEPVLSDDSEAQTHEMTTVLESKEPQSPASESQSPASEPAAENGQASVPATVLNVDGGATADHHPNSSAAQSTRLPSWAVGNTDVVEGSASHQAPQKSSITSPIPTIRVQPTTESDEMALSSEDFDERNLKSISHKARKQGSEGPAGDNHDIHSATPASGVSPSQVDAASPTAAASSTPAPATAPATPSAPNSRAGMVKDGASAEYPGITKLAVRKARNVASNKLVLSIFLGREVAESTKRQLQERLPHRYRHVNNLVFRNYLRSCRFVRGD